MSTGKDFWPWLRVSCPVCAVPAGSNCKDPRGNYKHGRPHKTRVNAARKEKKP